MNPERDLSYAKHFLLRALLLKPTELWTESEIEIGYHLMKDADIQKTLTLADELLKRRKSHEE